MAANAQEAATLDAPSASSSEEPRVDSQLIEHWRTVLATEPDEFVPPPPPRPLEELYPDGIAAALDQIGEREAMGRHDRKPPPPPPPPEKPSDEHVLSKTDAASVLAAVRATRAARSTVDGAAAGPPLQKHSFLACFGDVEPTHSCVLEVVNKDGDSVPATSLCQFIQQAAAEQLEVYREIKNRGLLMPRELPIAAPYKHAVTSDFTGVDKGMHNWRAYKELWEAGEADREPCASVPGQPRGRVLSFLVDAEAIAALVERQASADAATLALGQALADDVVGNVLPFVAMLPRDDDEVVAFLKAQCSTDCGGAGANGLYLEVAESEDYKGRHLADIAIFSTREGEFSYVEPQAALPERPVLPDHATLSAAGPEAAHSALRALCAPTGRAGDKYGFSAAGSDERVVSLPSPWLARQNEEVERVSQYFRDFFRPRHHTGTPTYREEEMAPAYQDPGSEQYEERRAAAAQPSPFVNLLEACSNFRPRDAA